LQNFRISELQGFGTFETWCVINPRAATGQWACGFGVKVPRGREKICATRWSPIFFLTNNDCDRARFTPKPGPISQSPRSLGLFEEVKDQVRSWVTGA
jgi:hypothetical protein